MTSAAPTAADRADHGPRADWRVLCATTRVHLLRFAANPVMLVRAPLGPILLLVAFTMTYRISGQSAVHREDVVGFLVIGVLGMQAWTATVWGSGNALQSEIYAGTVGTIVAAPTRLAPVVLGHGVGGIVWEFPGLLSCVMVGTLFGAQLDVTDPVAAAVSLAAVYAGSLCVGLAFSGLFILSKQSNALSNVLQAPIYLLGGFFVPRSELPGWLHPLSDAIPLAHALDALRATTLAGRSLADAGGPLLASAATSAAFFLVGVWSLRRLDDAVRRRGTLDLL